MAGFDNRLTISPVLVGRAKELRAFEALFTQTRNGIGNIAILSGEAGIGKTRFIAEVKRRFAEGDIPANSETAIFQGNCFELDQSFPYAPVLDLLRNALNVLPSTFVSEQLGPALGDLTHLMPEVNTFVRDLLPSQSLDPELEKYRINQAFIRIFSRLSASQPIVIVIEDIHWSDEATLDLLLGFARRLTASSILLLLTYRSEEVRPSLTRFLDNLVGLRTTLELPLQRLEANDVDLMIQATLGLRGSIPAQFLNALYALTEGNPLFIEEVLKDFSEQTLDFNEAEILNRLRIPRAIQLIVQRRSDELPPASRNLLTLGAAIGRRFDSNLLRHLSAYTELELLECVKSLVAAQFIVEETDDLYFFRHGLIRETIYSALPARERQALHLKIADTISYLYPDQVDSWLGDLSYHSFEAKQWAKASDYAYQAGVRALAVFSLPEALSFFTRALEASGNLVNAEKYTLLHERGHLFEMLGDFESALSDHIQALTLAEQNGDEGAHWRCLMDLGQLWTGRSYGRAGEYFQEALAAARLLDKPSFLALTLNQIGNWYFHQDLLVEALHHHAEALTIFQNIKDERGLAATYDLLGITSFGACRVIAGSHYYRHSAALYRKLGDTQGLIAALANIRPAVLMSILSRWPLTKLADTLFDGEEAIRLAHQMGWQAGEAFALMYLAQGLGVIGEYGRALALSQTSLDIALDIDHRMWTLAAYFTLGALHFELLAYDVALQHLESALVAAKQVGSLFMIHIVHAFTALTLIAQGDLEKAGKTLDAVLMSQTPVLTTGQRLIWYARAKLALAKHDIDLVFQIVHKLLEADAESVEEDDNNVVIPYLRVLRAEAEIASGQLDTALATLEEARQVALVQGLKPLLWRIWVQIGRINQLNQTPTVASQAHAAARMIAEELAASVTDKTVRKTFMQQFAVILAASQPNDSQSLTNLTVREHEIARLIAEGKSNRAIAEHLVLSERTIEKHVEKIFSKLGFSSRSQVAAWIVESDMRGRSF